MKNKKTKIAVLAALLAVLTVSTYKVYDTVYVEPTRILYRCFTFKEGAMNSPLAATVVIKVTDENSESYGMELLKIGTPSSYEDFIAKTILEQPDTRLDKAKFNDYFVRVGCD